MKKLFATILALVMILAACSALADGGFTVRNVNCDTATLAKAAVPEGYQMADPYVSICGDDTCLGYPIRVMVTESSDQTGAMMIYYSGETFIQRVSHSYLKHKEGTLDEEFVIFMKEYMPAYNYCWEKASMLLDSFNTTFGTNAQLKGTNLDDLTSFSASTAAREEYIRENIVPGLEAYKINVDWVEATAAERVFTFDVDGQTYYISVFAEDFGYEFSTKTYNTTTILWEVPYFFALLCPAETYQQVHDTDYRIFRENTGTNDEFISFSESLTEKIRDTVIKEWNMKVAASMAYMETMTNLTFSMVESSLGGSYSTSDRFSDYIFDQNDYTTLDGSHVKVSTSYDYVYQSGPSVYFTNDALSIPSGATMLTPN